MKYSGLIENDFTAAPGVCVSFFTQGCPHRCVGCHNPETWDFEGGKEFTSQTLEDIIQALTANGIQRNFCLMGGEPLCDENLFLSFLVLNEVKNRVPEAKIYIWTGYTIEELMHNPDPKIKPILTEMADYLIDGRYIDRLRDITLPMRGSSNQRIIDLKQFDFNKKI